MLSRVIDGVAGAPHPKYRPSIMYGTVHRLPRAGTGEEHYKNGDGGTERGGGASGEGIEAVGPLGKRSSKKP